MIQCHALADQNGHVVRFVYQLLLARGLLLLYLGSLCVQRAASGTCRGALLCYVMLYYVNMKCPFMCVFVRVRVDAASPKGGLPSY